MMLKAWAPRRDRKGLRVIHEHDTVRITHRDRGDLECSPVDHERFAQHPSWRTLHRNLSPFQAWLTHLHTDLVHDRTARKQLQLQHTRQGLDLDSGVLRHAVVVHILGQATNAVAAHLRLTAVGVEHAHAEIGLGRGKNQNQAIGADAKMSVTDRPRHLCRMVDLLLEAIHIDVVIPYAVHFGKFHARTSLGEVCLVMYQYS